MKVHAFLYGVVGRRHELERGMAGKDPRLFQRMLDELRAYARLCDDAGYAGIGLPEHHLQIEGFEAAQEPGLLALAMGLPTTRLRLDQFGYVLPTHHPLRVAEHAATLDHLLRGRLNVAFVRGYQARWFDNFAVRPDVRAVGAWNERTEEDHQNRELFEECVEVILRAWRHDTFAHTGRHWTFPAASRLPHDHPVYTAYGQGVAPDGTVREIGIAPRPLQQPIPLYGGFTSSLRTVLYWARVGGKPIVMSDNMDFCELAWEAYRDEAERHGHRVPVGEEAAWGGYLVLADSRAEAEVWAEDCLWYWNTWCVPFGRAVPPLLVGDADTICRKLEQVSRHVTSNEVFLHFGQGILDRDRCLRTLELFAERVMPRFGD